MCSPYALDQICKEDESQASTEFGTAVASGSAAKGRDAYLKLLSSGSSQYPVDLLKEAGVDMTTSKPIEAAMREMNRVMGENERIYARRRG